MFQILTILATILAAVLCVLAALLCSSISWMFQTWSNLTMDELVYHMMAPLDGTNQGMIADYLSSCVAPTVLVLLILIVLFIQFRKKTKAYYALLSGAIVIAILTTSISVRGAWTELDVTDYANNQGTYSEFIDAHYVNPRDVEITFPEQKRNLIYIFLESMEITYADEQNGGAFEENCIPELTQLAQENEDFSGADDSTLNGGYAMPGALWTIAGMFSQSAGIPLNIPIEGNSMDTQETFFDDVVTIGDVLSEAKYNQTLLVGSDATFGGRRLMYETHGDFEIIDHPYALEAGWIPKDYNVWWGYEDKKLFGFAKEQLQDLSSRNEPFNFTMLTVDTHFENGYPCDLCPDTFGTNQYANVMACSSKQVSEFIEWIQQQDFYENTTIVISGDHPTMDSDFCAEVDKNYIRKVYTTYINPAVESETVERRNYTTFDNYPTTLASLGAKIEGNRLGLGTNLFSVEPTLTERFGIESVWDELLKKSKLLERLGSIDENSEALALREGRVVSPVADVTTGEYSPDTGTLPVYVSNIQGVDSGIQSMLVAVWHDEDQNDLTWIQATMQADGSYVGTINVPDFDYKTGEYYIDAYVVDNDGEQYVLGSTTGVVN